jgi:hypothetical protein
LLEVVDEYVLVLAALLVGVAIGRDVVVDVEVIGQRVLVDNLAAGL